MPLEVLRAGSVRDAAALIGAAGTSFVAGGTLVVRDVNSGDASIRRAGAVGRPRPRSHRGRRRPRRDRRRRHAWRDRWRIRTSPSCSPVAGAIGGPAVRAMATVGGNLFAPYPYGDFAVALLALGAEVTVEDAERQRDCRPRSISRRGASSAAARIVRAVSLRAAAAGQLPLRQGRARAAARRLGAVDRRRAADRRRQDQQARASPMARWRRRRCGRGRSRAALEGKALDAARDRRGRRGRGGGLRAADDPLCERLVPA